MINYSLIQKIAQSNTHYFIHKIQQLFGYNLYSDLLQKYYNIYKAYTVVFCTKPVQFLNQLGLLFAYKTVIIRVSYYFIDINNKIYIFLAMTFRQ